MLGSRRSGRVYRTRVPACATLTRYANLMLLHSAYPAERRVCSLNAAALTATKTDLLDLRKDIFQLLALLTLPVPLGDEERAALGALIRRLEAVNTHLHDATHKSYFLPSDCPTSGPRKQRAPPQPSTRPTLRFN